ncbi:MAG: preprotein translocase subunit SecG [Planctomycetaceae bacterium]
MIALVRFALGFMLVLTALFLILLVLIQRGRGGGLTGALGGAGGQSAFGTKAGDVFTRITVGVAAFWIGLCILSLNVLGRRESPFSGGLGGNAPQAVAPQTPPAGAPAPSGAAPSGGEGIVIPDQQPQPPAQKADEGAKPTPPATETNAPAAPPSAAEAPASTPEEPAAAETPAEPK